MSRQPHILIIKPSSLGDVVHTLPSLAALRKAHPEAHIAWVINPEWAPLLDQNPDLDEVLIFPRQAFRGPLGVWKFLTWLRSGAVPQVDWALDFQCLLRSALITRASGAARRAGLSDSREGAYWFYNEIVSLRDGLHSVERYQALASHFGASVGDPPIWRLPVGQAPAGVRVPNRFLLLHPFSRGQGKSMSPEQVEHFCRCIGPDHPILLCGRSELDLSSLSLPDNVISLLNRTSLQELVFLARAATGIVSVDSGPMHIASAVNPNLLGIHTWSDPRKVGPFNPAAYVWQNHKIFQFGELQSAKFPQSKSASELDRQAIEQIASLTIQKFLSA